MGMLGSRLVDTPLDPDMKLTPMRGMLFLIMDIMVSSDIQMQFRLALR